MQYKVFIILRNPNPKFGIRKPWDENPYHGLKTFRWKIVENNPKKKKFWGSAPEPPDPLCRYNFATNAPKPIGGALASYPPPTHVD